MRDKDLIRRVKQLPAMNRGGVFDVEFRRGFRNILLRVSIREKPKHAGYGIYTTNWSSLFGKTYHLKFDKLKIYKEVRHLIQKRIKENNKFQNSLK